jgi:uncharacterized protein YjiS (DUF1127 family)
MELLKETYRIWALHREFRSALAELNKYSDCELTELGLSRGDVVAVAYKEAERRVGPPEVARTDDRCQAAPAASH